jgi:hypothetical protein
VDKLEAEMAAEFAHLDVTEETHVEDGLEEEPSVA